MLLLKKLIIFNLVNYTSISYITQYILCDINKIINYPFPRTRTSQGEVRLEDVGTRQNKKADSVTSTKSTFLWRARRDSNP